MATLEAEVKKNMEVNSNPTRAALEKVRNEANGALTTAGSALKDLGAVISKSDGSLAQGKKALEDLAKVIADPSTPANIVESLRLILAGATNSGLGGDAARNTLATGSSLAQLSITSGLEAIRELTSVINSLPAPQAAATQQPVLVFSAQGSQSANAEVAAPVAVTAAVAQQQQPTTSGCKVV